jgi:hypothetical protein
MPASGSTSGSDPIRIVKVVAAAVLGLAAIVVLAWQVPKHLAGPIVLPPGNESPETIAMMEDLAKLRALDVPALQAEVQQRERALAAARQAGDAQAISNAMTSLEMAKEELAHRPR